MDPSERNIDNGSLEEEITRLTSVVSRAYVPEPSKNAVIADFLDGFSRFQRRVRWIDFFKNHCPVRNSKNDPEDQDLGPILTALCLQLWPW